MANKDVVESIEKLKAARARRLLDIVDGEVATQRNFTTSRAGLVFGLRFLVDDFRRQAELVMDSGARGKGAEATALRGTASALSLLADAVDTVDLDGPAEVLPSRGGPKLPAEWCGETDEHGPHDHDLEQGHPRLHCMGHHVRDTSGLKALVQDSSGAMRAVVDLHATADGGLVSDPVPACEVEAFQFADPAGGRRDGDMEAYLSGESNTMPPIRNDREPGETSGIAAAVLTLTETDSRIFVTPRTNTPEMKEAAAAMFVDPTPVVPTGDPVMPGRRMSWADLRKDPTVPPPEHMSFSQGGTLDGCGLQYRLERLEPEVVQRPKWATVGGTALHGAAEWFERQALKAGIGDRAGYMVARLEIAGGVEAVWKEHFAKALTEQVMRTPLVPPGDWKAGGRGGAEGWTWWQVEGAVMLKRYLDSRIAEMTAPERGLLLLPLGEAVIEHEGTLDVEGVPVKVVIDQAWRWGEGGAALLIDDLKSGAYAPPGTYQLGLYAWYLRRQQGYDCEIWGRFWDARNGRFSEPINLLEAHPWDEVVMRVHAQAKKKELRLFNPTPDWGNCGKCTVKHACPAALTRG